MSLTKEELILFLHSDVAPALGCTEPVAVALCTASASRSMQNLPARIEVSVNPNIYKNGMSAGIPHFDKVGLEYAAALGAYLKNPEKKLELLSGVTEKARNFADTLVSKNGVSVKIDPSHSELYIRCTLINDLESCTCVIQNAHTHIVSIEKNGKLLFSAENSPASSRSGFTEALMGMKISEMRALVDLADVQELSFMMDGISMNEELSAYSDEHASGVGLANAIRRLKGGDLLADDLMTRIQLKVMSAAENRLDGCPLPAMSSSGAGTKGLVVILPISETAKAVHASREKTVKALAFGHLVNRYINAHIGKLAPMCTCAIAASTAACAAMTWLLGGDDSAIGNAVRNMTGTIPGMICDGGKVGCALKVACSSSAALLCALAAVNGAALRSADGICAETPEECIMNISRIADPGMLSADREILNIMLEKKKWTVRT